MAVLKFEFRRCLCERVWAYGSVSDGLLCFESVCMRKQTKAITLLSRQGSAASAPEMAQAPTLLLPEGPPRPQFNSNFQLLQSLPRALCGETFP